MPIDTAQSTITIAHSPDSDDAFMFYGLATNKLDTGRLTFKHLLKDIQTLNEEVWSSVTCCVWSLCSGLVSVGLQPILVRLADLFHLRQRARSDIALVGIVRDVILVIRLRFIERVADGGRGYNRMTEDLGLIELIDVGFCDTLLLVIRAKDCRAILCTVVGSLAV